MDAKKALFSFDGDRDPAKERNMNQIRIITCPACGYEIRRENQGREAFLYGSPFRKCMKCGKEYYDNEYHEIALEQDPPLSADHQKKDKRWYKALHHAEIREAEEYRRSCERLTDRKYLSRLYDRLYHGSSERKREWFDLRIRSNLSDCLDVLSEKIGPPPGEFRLKFSDALFSQLSYEARQPAAVEHVVRQILAHYGVDGRNITVQTEYQQKNLRKESGTLGTFTATVSQIGIRGGIIKMVLVEDYSTYDAIIAVALHECAHALLYARNAELPDRDRNEILTDMAAIYMGGGAYYQRGCYAFSSFRIGYLYKMECEWIRGEVSRRRSGVEAAEKKMREDAGRERQNRIRELTRRLEALDVKMKGIHPGRVIREKGIALNAFRGFAEWHEQEDGIVLRAGQLAGSAGSLDEMKKDLLWIGETERKVTAWEKLADEWAQAEEHQAGLSREKAEILRGMIPLAESGNVFARLEFVRLWASCDATTEDAWVYIHGFMDREEPDQLCAVGICLMEGLGGAKDEARGRSVLCRAASLGSRDAARILGA